MPITAEPYPISSDNHSFYVRVDSIEGFKRRWLPGCEALGLQMIPFFLSPGFLIGSKSQFGANEVDCSVDDIVGELSQLREWVLQNQRGADRSYMETTLDELITKLVEVVAKGVIVYIG